VQDEISGAVVDALKVQLLSSRPLTSRHQTDNTEAYSQYLLSNQLRLRDTTESIVSKSDHAGSELCRRL
jgi:hypothetical protein